MYYNQLGEKIVFVDQYSKNKFFFVYLAGITYPNPDYIAEHNSNRFNKWENYVFEYIVSGKGMIESGNARHMVRGGDFVFQNKNCRLTYMADRRQPFEKMFIVLRGRLVDKLTEAYMLNDNVVIIHDSGVNQEFSDMLRLLELSRVKSETYREMAILVHRLLQRVCGMDAAESSPEAAGLTTAGLLREYIDDNPGSINSLDDLASYVNLSRSQIIRVFRAEYGLTPMKYLMTVRIERAEYLMRMTPLSIQDIAVQLGFVDGRHFATAYKQIRSTTPSAYRKEWLRLNRP